jgi:transcriptional regulator with XRE-family HTH domain
MAKQAQQPVRGKKSPNPTDIHVGSRVRLRRMMLGMSQEKLGDALGITFQQIQKYEKGTNRIGASRLQHIASVLSVTPGFFFDDGPAAPGNLDPEAVASADMIRSFLSTSEGMRLASNFVKIKDGDVRQAIIKLVAVSATQPG